MILEVFTKKCLVLQEKVRELNYMLYNMSEKLIQKDFLAYLDVALKPGSNVFTSINWLNEIFIDKSIFTLIYRRKDLYKGYVLYFAKEFNTIGLGFLYKNDLVSPHIKAQEENLISKYSASELDEIAYEIDKRIKYIVEDIRYIKTNTDLNQYEHYYRNYESGGFEGQEKYENLGCVIDDFKMLTMKQIL